MKTFFKKLEYRLLVECTKIEKVTFLCKITLLEANVKANHKEQSFSSNYFTFWKILFQFKNLL